MTPTDVEGWVRFAPVALAAILIILALAGLLENTDRGRRLTDRLIDRVEGDR